MKKLAADSILMLGLFCLLTTFVEAVYTFGLLGTDIPPEIVCVLFLLSPLLLLVVPGLTASRRFALITACAALLCWGASMPLGTRWRMLATGAGCGLMLLSLPARFRGIRRGPVEQGAGIVIGLLLVIALRALRSGNLLLSDGAGLWIGEALAAAGCLLLVLSAAEEEAPANENTQGGAGQAGSIASPTSGSWRTPGLCLGIAAVIVLLYSAFSSPTVLARWGEARYPLVTLVQAGSAALFLSLWAAVPRIRAWLSSGAILGWNVLFLLAFALALFLRQPSLGAGASYPVSSPDPGFTGGLTFWAAIVLHPVLYLDFALLVAGVHSLRPTPRSLAAGFVIGALFLLLAVFAQIFTTVYDYIPVIGPVFRNGYWLVLVIPGVVAALAMLLLPSPHAGAAIPKDGGAPQRLPAAAAVFLAAIAVVLAFVPGGRPAAAGQTGRLRIMSYNLQQGYGKTGEKSFDLQKRVILRMSPDVVGLEETDTARIAGGNEDLVRYLADSLGMYSCYGPTPESGTFGIALLSRYPIEEARTFFMPSRGEQTAAIDARIRVNGKVVSLLVTHLDNDGAMPQQRLVAQRAVTELQGSSPSTVAVAMGDFNFDPSTEQYRYTTGLLEDAWLHAEQKIVEPGASDPAGRIDHIFLTPGTRVLSSRYLPEGPSDHPAIVADIEFP